MNGIRRGLGGVRAVAGAIALTATLTVGLGGCAVTPSTSGASDPALRGEWVLSGGSDTFGAIKLVGQDITLSITDATAATGRSSCSNYSVTIYGAERNLWITTTVPHTYTCATADQNVIQLEYLGDLERVQHAVVTSGGLELAGQGVDLSFTRAFTPTMGPLDGTSWQLLTAARINPNESFESVVDTNATLTFRAPNLVSGTTSCERFSAHYRSQADQLVIGAATVTRNPACSLVADQPNIDLMSVLSDGFSYQLGINTLTVTSTRAGLVLGFDKGSAS